MAIKEKPLADGAIRLLFREVNERVFEAQDTFAVQGPAEFFCECADGGCSERLEAPREQYQWVREQADAWLVLPGHEDEGERVLVHADEYLVVAAARLPGREQ